MGFELYTNYRPNSDSQALIAKADAIIKTFQAGGMVMSLRQLYYQCVKANIIENTDKSYERMGRLVSRARLGGYLDWDAIEDRNRVPVIWRQYASVVDSVYAALQTFRLPRLQDQDTYVELWVEKDALSGVLRPIASEYHITVMANKGYSSSSAMKDAGDRIRRSCERYGSKNAVILYIGDLDPSGEDMVRDIQERILDFTNNGLSINWDDPVKVAVEDYDDMRERKPYIDVEVRKLALTIEQVREFNPPPNPTKLTDSRAKGFIAKYGTSSWEVDALPPTVLRDLIREAFEDLLDMETMREIIDVDEPAEEVRLQAALDGMTAGHDPEALHAALAGVCELLTERSPADEYNDSRWDVAAALEHFRKS